MDIRVPFVKKFGQILAERFVEAKLKKNPEDPALAADAELPLTVMIVGANGVGKSCFINTVLDLYGDERLAEGLVCMCVCVCVCVCV